MITLSHTRKTLCAVVAGGLLLGCGNGGSDLTSPSPEFDHRPNHRPGDGGPPQPDASFEMTLAGAIATGTDVATLQGDTKRQLNFWFATQTTVAFTNTLGTDELLATNCFFEEGAVPIPQDVKDQGIADLRNSTYERNVTVRMDKKASVGSVYLHPAEGETDPSHGLIQFGGNAGDPPPDVEVLSGDPDQKATEWSEPLVLRYTGGRVRKLLPVQDNTATSSLNCANQDEVIVTIERVNP